MKRKLTGSVGRKARNQKADVEQVQALLNQYIRRLPPLKPLVVDGKSGPKTVAAIERFQKYVQERTVKKDGKVQFRVSNGRVTPGDATFKALMNDKHAGPEGACAFRYDPLDQAELAVIADQYLGVAETGKNRIGKCPRMREIFEADDFERKLNGKIVTDGYAWCCAFVSLCVQKFIARNRMQYGHVTPPRVSLVSRFLTQWAVKERCLIFPANSTAYTPHRGDIVIFKMRKPYDHIGIVRGTEGGRILTIEGNTTADGKRGSQRDGGVVAHKSRRLASAQGFIRMPAPDLDRFDEFSRMV